MEMQAALDDVREDLARVRSEFGKRIVGNLDTLDFMLKALLTGGHILIEGLPGLGKTRMVKTVAEILDLEFRRIQFTPDLMPADITGTNLLVEDERGGRHFRFEKGPIFTNILLADEINRASPKTQSALLQAMEEREATLFGESHPIDSVFLTLATQNPIEMAGTYPLPEAQLDRFLVKLRIPFPGLDRLKEIARLNVACAVERDPVAKALNRERILEIQEFLCEIPVTDRIYDFAADLVHLTHPEAPGAPEATRKYVKYGASPRGLNALLLTARVSAVLDGRFHLAVEDLEENYLPCLRHRLVMNFEAEVDETGPDQVLEEIFSRVGKKR